MSEQPGTSRLKVALASFFLVAALAAFAAAFYLVDGMSLVTELFGAAVSQPVASTPTSQTPAASLQLPAQMPEDFALRLWQEQIDSQSAIWRLVSGDVKSMRTDRVEVEGEAARLNVTVRFQDGTNAPGVLGFRKFGDEWYIAYATGMRRGATGGAGESISTGDGGSPDGELPEKSEVDLQLLNTMIEQNRLSQDVIVEYLEGTVRQVTINRAVRGPDTVTLQATMDEDGATATANLVAIRRDVDGQDLWFLTRFTKTGHTPPE